MGFIDITVSGGKGRTCDGCNRCCFTHAVEEVLAKKEFVECEHACKIGCAIYKKRPPPCRGYRCAWLQGNFSEYDRPDKAGLVVDMQNTVFGWTWVVHMLDEKKAQRLIDYLFEKTPYPLTIITEGGGRKLMLKNKEQFERAERVLGREIRTK